MMTQNHRLTSHPVLFLFLFIIASVLLFSVSFNRDFASDDYCILDYLFNNDKWIVPGFFRPVGDLTLKWTYYLFGWDPFYFFLINAMIHGFNTWLLYLFCSKLISHDDKRLKWLPAVAAIIFLCYHSLGEVVLWTIGRGISLAVTFAMMAMVIFVSKLKELVKYILVCVFYFVSFSCYESVLLLPVVLMVIGKMMNYRIRYGVWSFVLLLTALINLYIRYLLAGKIWSAYQGEIFAKGLTEYATTFIKVVFRIFVPAFNQPMLFTIAALMIITLVCYLFFFKVDRKSNSFRIGVIAFSGILFSALIAMFFGASTRTSEGDRLLYFPSIFYSLLAAVLILGFVQIRKWMPVVVVLAGIQLYFLFSTQMNWIKASAQAKNIIIGAGEKQDSSLYVINLPSDYRGAFIFRNCFKEALVHHQVRVKEVVTVNQLDYTRSLDHKDVIIPERIGNEIFIWPETRLKMNNDTVVSIEAGTRLILADGLRINEIAFWNRERLVFLDSAKR